MLRKQRQVDAVNLFIWETIISLTYTPHQVQTDGFMTFFLPVIVPVSSNLLYSHIMEELMTPGTYCMYAHSMCFSALKHLRYMTDILYEATEQDLKMTLLLLLLYGER